MQAKVPTRWISSIIAQAQATHAPLPWSRSAKRARRNAKASMYMLSGAA